MKLLRHLSLSLLAFGLAAIPVTAQSSGSSNNNQQTGQYASGQTSAQPGHESNGGMAMSDQQFITKAAQDNIGEIQVAKLAEQKASDNNIKQMAQRFINDHQQNEQQLKQVAQQLNVTLPDKPSAKAQAKYDKLSKLNGKEFDQAFMRDQVKDHQHDVALFQKVESSAKDQAVKAYASQTLPTLKEHLQIAESTAQQDGIAVGQGHPHETASSTRASNNQQ